MARGQSRAQSEAGPSAAETAQQDALVAKIPKRADYLFGFQPAFDQVSTASELFDYTEEWVQETLYDIGNKQARESYPDFDNQLAKAVKEATESATYNNGGLSDWELTSRFEATEGKDYTTVLKAEGAPEIEIKWTVSVDIDTDDYGGTYLKESFNLKSLKLK